MRQGLLFSIIMSIIFCSPVLAYDWSTNSGDGSPNNPYQISTAEQLMSIGSNPTLLDNNFILMNDIVFDPDNNPAHRFTRAVIAPYVDSSSPVFTGTFNGNGYQIVNLYISHINNNYLGLFGKVVGTGHTHVQISNLTLADCLIETSAFSGLLAGKIEFSNIESCAIVGNSSINSIVPSTSSMGGLTSSAFYSTISNCTSEADVNGNSFRVGGLIGTAGSCLIINCSSSGYVTGAVDIGGLVGLYRQGVQPAFIEHDEIINCYATGRVEADGDRCGGLIGRIIAGLVQNCFASGDVIGESMVGGLIGNIEMVQSIGYDDTVINGCFASGAVEGVLSQVGGLIGRSDANEVIDCSALGNTSGNTSVGGLIGYNLGEVVRSFSAGQVTGTTDIGGLLGYNSGTLSLNYFLETSGPDNGYGTPLDDPNMMIQENFAGWDFLGESTNGENEIWRMCVDGVDYPRLSWEFAQNGDFACGDGTDIVDLQAMCAEWLSTLQIAPATFNHACDANGDEKIDLIDFSVLGENWQEFKL